MPQAALAFSAAKRTGLPEAVTVNCLVEKTDTKGPFSLLARPGQEAFATVGTKPFRALWQKQGLLDNAALVVALEEVYTLDATANDTLLTGALAGSGLLEIDGGLDADGETVIRAATADALYQITSTTVTLEAFPTTGGAGATSVCFHKGYWIAVEAGTDFLYYQPPTATTWSAIEFAAAEYKPDKLVAVRSVGDLIALLGERSFEAWRATGVAASPLEPAGGLSFDVGCRSKHAAVNCAGTLVWVDENCIVRRWSGGEPIPVSDYGLTEQISRVDAADLRASFFVVRGHPIYSLTLGDEATWQLDLSNDRWVRASSQGYDYWRSHLFCNIDGDVLAADALSNQIYRLDPDRHTDGSDTFTMEWCAFIEAKEQAVPLANVQLECEVGGSPLSGQGSAPLVWLQVSRDQGKTFGPKKYKSLGSTGAYGTRVRWNALGEVPAPHGAVLKFGCSDPVVRRVTGVSFNVP